MALVHSERTGRPLATISFRAHGADMSFDEQRAYARPDVRVGDGSEVIGDAPSGVTEPVALNGSGESPTVPQPVSPPQGPAAPLPGFEASAQAAAHQPVEHTQPLGEAVPVEAADPWGHPTGDPWTDVTPGGPPAPQPVPPAPDSRRRRLGGAAGLFVAGAVAGALVTGAWTNWGSGDAAAASAVTGPAGQAAQGGGQAGVPGQQPGRLPGAGQGGQNDQNGQGGQGGQGLAGGNDSEVRLVGRLTAVSGTKVTLVSAAGSATYTVVSTTRIVRNGAAAQASDLHVGDLALVHAFPNGASSGGVLELIYARSTVSPGTPGSEDSARADDSTT